ncbi:MULTISPECIES: phage tail-collar fiber domain-containing protein [unclassified Citrobacter]|uniref:phage tail-collar fiber domain-containing protein n=1 Tax=unclassified Citrobacter TaxID=2644389 RepID=UPI00227A6F36|nr:MULTISPECIES: phage tail protein [unclassified Citrobacter]
MSQAVITKVFSEWKAQQAINNQPVTLDEFIFAYIPGLDADKPIDNTETTPAADKIVYRQAVRKSGVVNENSVVYSVTLGADVGDFDFNWIGLANKATGTLAMIIHAPTQRKIKNANGQQGNVLVRSMLMEYSGAREATEITTPAETWQIDFTARLAAMDERQRRENIDLYGAAAFFDSGYLVAKSGNQFFVTKGAGYVAGLRAELPADLNINAAAKPTKVWLDVSWTGTLTSEWAVQSKITVAADLADYVLGGVQHYVFAVASIDAAGNITDLRPKGTLNDQTASDALRKHEQSRNHPDATTSAKGFTQLNSATDSTSEELAATPKAVKIAMDNANARLAKERNGADIPNPPLFAQNIGLGKTDSPEFGGLKAPSITLRDGKISLTSSTDGTTLVFTVSGEPVAEIKAGSFFHKKIISAGEVLQSPKYIFRDGDIIFYSGTNNLVMQVGGNDVATLTPENFYHVKQVAAAESLSAPKVILRPGDVNLVSGKNNLVTQVGGNDVATLTPDSFYHVKQVAAAESLKAPKVILRDGDVNLISGANNLVIQVGGNDIASLTPGNNFFKGKLTAETSLQVGSTCILATDGNLTGSKWGGWLDAFMKDGMSTDGNGLWWDAFSSQLQFRVGDWNIPDAAGGAGTSVTFPKAFKNGCLMVIPTPGAGGSSEQIGSQSYSASGAVLQKGASDKNPRSGKYLAIGY